MRRARARRRASAPAATAATRARSDTARSLSPQTVARSSRDPCRARIGGELARQDRADTSTLVLVGDRERDLGGSPLTNEPRDADRLRVAAEIAHEHVVLGVDPREDPEVMR